MTGLGRSPQTPGRSLQAPATLHGQSWFFYYFFYYFSSPFWLYRKRMEEVFAQACNFPNKQTRVNWGVEQGLGLPAVPSAPPQDG